MGNQTSCGNGTVYLTMYEQDDPSSKYYVCSLTWLIAAPVLICCVPMISWTLLRAYFYRLKRFHLNSVREMVETCRIQNHLLINVAVPVLTPKAHPEFFRSGMRCNMCGEFVSSGTMSNLCEICSNHICKKCLISSGRERRHQQSQQSRNSAMSGSDIGRNVRQNPDSDQPFQGNRSNYPRAYPISNGRELVSVTNGRENARNARVISPSPTAVQVQLVVAHPVSAIDATTLSHLPTANVVAVSSITRNENGMRL